MAGLNLYEYAFVLEIKQTTKQVLMGDFKKSVNKVHSSDFHMSYVNYFACQCADSFLKLLLTILMHVSYFHGMSYVFYCSYKI